MRKRYVERMRKGMGYRGQRGGTETNYGETQSWGMEDAGISAIMRFLQKKSQKAK